MGRQFETTLQGLGDTAFLAVQLKKDCDVLFVRFLTAQEFYRQSFTKYTINTRFISDRARESSTR